MKTSALIFGAVLLTAGAFGQGAVIVESAPTLEMGQAELNAKLTRILSEAEKQNEKLQTSLDRMGDPAAVNLASVNIIKRDMDQSSDSLKTKDEQREAMKNITGAEAFNDDAMGVMEPIGSKMTRNDGVEIDRDPARYRMESAMMEQIREFRNVREKALQRKKTLTDEMSAVVDELEEAKDQATIQKLNAMIDLLRGQVEECNQTILIAQADAEMAQKELANTAQIITKGKQEELVIKDDTSDPNAPPRVPTTAGPFGGVGEGGTARPLIPNLTWGRRQTTPDE